MFQTSLSSLSSFPCFSVWMGIKFFILDNFAEYTFVLVLVNFFCRGLLLDISSLISHYFLAGGLPTLPTFCPSVTSLCCFNILLAWHRLVKFPHPYPPPCCLLPLFPADLAQATLSSMRTSRAHSSGDRPLSPSTPMKCNMYP